MKTSKVLLIVIIVVLINNVFLLSYLSKDSETSMESAAGGKELPARANSSDIEQRESYELSNSVASLDIQTESFSDNVSAGEVSAASEADISSAVRQFIQSAEFERVLDNYQTQAAPRHEEMQSRLSTMSASELYSLAIDSSNSYEQKYAQQFLIHSGFGELGVEELKGLYHADGVSKWVQQNILPRLLEEGDAEAIVWAKQLLDDSVAGQHIKSEIYSSIYDVDPDFIKQHISDLDLDDFQQMIGVMSFVMQDPDLTKSFYEENFDELLSLKNSSNFEFLYAGAELELSHRQQSSLAEMFSSKSSKRRGFAIRQAGNIDDVNILRDAYSRLSKNSEKLSFLKTLSGKKNNTDMAKLVQELAADSDNADIRKLIRR